MALSNRFGQRVAPQFGGPGMRMQVNAPGGGATPPPVPHAPGEEEGPPIDVSKLGGLLGMLARKHPTAEETAGNAGGQMPDMAAARFAQMPDMSSAIGPAGAAGQFGQAGMAGQFGQAGMAGQLGQAGMGQQSLWNNVPAMLSIFQQLYGSGGGMGGGMGMGGAG